MKVQNHLLTAPADTSLQSPNKGGTITPTVIVLHYTASGGEDGQSDADYLSRASSRASAHVVVGRNGSIDQIVPFNKRAWHAGESEWNGRSDVNDFSIGIEIDNWGWLKNGKSHSGTVVPEEFRFKGTRSGFSEWEAYRKKQLEAVETVIAAIVKEYNIVDIVGHEDIAPGRKQDPGPALDEFKSKMQDKYLTDEKAETKPESKPSEAKKTASDSATTNANVNFRKTASVSSIVLKVLSKGRKVQILKKNIYPGWDFVEVDNRQGYVVNKYLNYA